MSKEDKNDNRVRNSKKNGKKIDFDSFIEVPNVKKIIEKTNIQKKDVKELIKKISNSNEFNEIVMSNKTMEENSKNMNEIIKNFESDYNKLNENEKNFIKENPKEMIDLINALKSLRDEKTQSLEMGVSSFLTTKKEENRKEKSI